jgi:hypothetical protein
MRLPIALLLILSVLSMIGCKAGSSDDELDLPIDLRFGGALTIVPGMPVVGETIQIQVAIRNAGSYPLPGTVVRVVVDGSVTQDVPVPAIPAFATTVVQASVAGLAVGSHPIVVTIDATNSIAEYDESDNQQTGAVVVSLPVSGNG